MWSRIRENIFVIGVSVVTTTVVVVAIIGVLVGIEMKRPMLFSWAIHKLSHEEGGKIAPLSTGVHSEDTVVNIVKRTNPAVVAIMVSKEVPKYEEYLRNMSPFGGFFNFQVPAYRQNGTEMQEIGGGSGFLVSQDGYIVTNKHVVTNEGAEYAVFTSDGTKYTARVVARDPSLDVAVIKIDGDTFPYLTFGDSDSLQSGQTVIAIGNALAEYRNTVSVGVVSGLSRSITAGDGRGSAENLNQLIQTDAAINPGNSGGPLLDLRGEVVGVNVAMANGAQSIGFSLSANSVKSVVDSVKKTGKIVRPYIGVRYVPITKDLAQKNHLSVEYGVLVGRGKDVADLAVIPGSPGDKAGIMENDIILEMDGKELTEDVDFASLIRAKSVGDMIVLKVLHKGVEKNMTVTLEEMK